MVWHNLGSGVQIYTLLYVFDGFLNKASQLKLPNRWRITVNIVSNTRSTFTCSKTTPLSVSFTEWKWNGFCQFVFATCFTYSGTYSRGAGALACIEHKAGKHPIHHTDNRDKHIYTSINWAFFQSTWHVYVELWPFLKPPTTHTLPCVFYCHY